MEREMAVDELVLMLIYPLSQRLFNLIGGLSLRFLDGAIDDVFDPELHVRILDICFCLKICDWFLLATACRVQLFLNDINHIWC